MPVNDTGSVAWPEPFVTAEPASAWSSRNWTVLFAAGPFGPVNVALRVTVTPERACAGATVMADGSTGIHTTA